MKNTDYKKSFLIYFLLFGVLVEAITVTVIFGYNYFDIKQQIKDKYQLEKNEKIDILKTTINQTKSSINAIVENRLFQSYIQDKNFANTQTIKDLFGFIMTENRFYLQVRYIDSFKNEKIRLDRTKFGLKVVDNNAKLNHNFLDNIFKNSNEKFWYSDIGLYVENKAIQTPYNPTFKIGQKIVINDKNKGIIVISLSMKNILLKIINSWNFDIFLIDKDGNYIFSKNKSWTKDLKQNDNFFKENMINKDQFDSKTYNKNGFFIESLHDIIPSQQGVYLVFKDRGFMIESIKENNYYATVIVMILVLLLSIPLAFFIAKIPSNLYEKLMVSFAKIKEFSSIIDKYVMSLSMDNESNIKDISTAFAQKGEYNKEEIIGKRYEEIIVNYDENNNVLENGEMLAKTKNGTHFWVEQTVSPLESIRGDKIGYASILFDISEKKEIKKQALTDHLTSLPNRRYLDEILKREIELAKRYGTIFSIFIIDIDHFKKINDTHGHIFGDNILKELSKIFTNHLRNTDNIGRYGGEEFLVVLPYTELEGAIITAENFRKEIESYRFEKDCKITASFGIAEFKNDDDYESIMKRADKALYEAKSRGRNRIFYL